MEREWRKNELFNMVAVLVVNLSHWANIDVTTSHTSVRLLILRPPSCTLTDGVQQGSPVLLTITATFCSLQIIEDLKDMFCREVQAYSLD